jgi:hypothetical protein
MIAKDQRSAGLSICAGAKTDAAPVFVFGYAYCGWSN